MHTMATRDALGFVRVSTGSQDESTQIKALQAYADDHDLNIVKFMKLHGYQASSGEQEPALREAIQGIEQGRWHTILVTDSSRLDRREDLDVQAEILLAIRQAGGDVISTTEPQFGKTDFAGRIVTLVAQHANAEKSRTVKNGTWRGIQEIIANGAWHGVPSPFWSVRGTRYHKEAYCPDPDAVEAMYTEVANGKTLSSVAREHDSYPQTIRKLIETEANYTGVFECRYTHNGQTYTWSHKVTPVVGRELWHKANRIIAKRGAPYRNLGGHPVQRPWSWLSGLLDCPRCGGILYVLAGKSLRCNGRGKNRRGCGVCGIPLDYVTKQIDAIVANDAEVYRYQKISGNQGELEELNAELDRVKQSLAITDDNDEFDKLSARRKELLKAREEFKLVPETYDMLPTGETLADLWRTGDKREIMKALQQYISFNVAYGDEQHRVKGYVWIEGFYPGETLIELTPDTCIKMDVSSSVPATPTALAHES
jgi:DNA invertase Pin-like site-specific DNA recombinase